MGSGLFLLFLLLFVFRGLLACPQRLFDVLGRFVGFTLRIDGGLRFVGFGRFRLLFELIRILKGELRSIGILVERNIALVFLTFLIYQTINIDGLPGFELIVLFIVEFLAPESSRNFIGWALLVILLGALRLLIIVAPVKQELYITLVCIELYVCIELCSFRGHHPLQIERFALH